MSETSPERAERACPEPAERISREAALRIGLAARELPDTDAGRLIEVLLACGDGNLSEESLAKLKVKDLKEAADGEFKDMPQTALKAAVARLHGEEAPPEPALPPVQEATGEAGAIRVACASNNGTELDGHFGSCARFMVYQVSAGDVRLIGIRNTVGDSQAEEKNEFRAELIADCQVLYVASIGGPAAAKVVKRGIHPIKFPQGGFLSSLLKNLQDTLKRNPPPWLAKVMGVGAEDRVRFGRFPEPVEGMSLSKGEDAE